MPKPRVAIISLTSCEGCQFAILDLGQKFLELGDKVDFTEFRLVAEHDEEVGHNHWSCSILHKKECRFDIAFVEGSPVTADNFHTLNEIRAKSKFLVALGTCAHLGCIQKIKNYINKKDALNYVYPETQQIDNPEIKPVSESVSVDLVIPGCPVNAQEFLQTIYDLLAGKTPKIHEIPICFECQAQRYECLLQKGEICFGPITLGGCEAVCLGSKMACWGCRGFLKEANIENMNEALKKILPESRFKKILEVFGVRDEYEQFYEKKLKK